MWQKMKEEAYFVVEVFVEAEVAAVVVVDVFAAAFAVVHGHQIAAKVGYYCYSSSYHPYYCSYSCS